MLKPTDSTKYGILPWVAILSGLHPPLICLPLLPPYLRKLQNLVTISTFHFLILFATMFDAVLTKLEMDLRTAFDENLISLVAMARTRFDGAQADMARVRAKELAEVARENSDLNREIAAMHMHKEAHEGRVVLNVGGFRYETSVQTLRRLPHTFFDAYFSGRYAQDVCADGSIFIGRDSKHFGQVLQYLRDGVVSAAEQDTSELNVSLLRLLKREFGFYCIEIVDDLQEIAFTVGGAGRRNTITATVERYDSISGVWREAASMANARADFALCTFDSMLYSIGGVAGGMLPLASVERYDSSLDSWSAAPPLPRARTGHCAVAVGDAMYVMGGLDIIDSRVRPVKSVLKFDIRAQSWSEVMPMPEHRRYAGACVLGSNVYLLGGKGPGNAFIATTSRYNADTDSWVMLAPMPQATESHGICAFGGLIHVLCGKASNNIASSVHRFFDPVANSWSTLAPMLTDRFASAAFVLNGSIHVAGGHDGRHHIISVERYNVAFDTWSSVGAMHYTRVGFAVDAIAVELNLFDELVLEAKRSQR
jgi:hypothetical protein